MTSTSDHRTFSTATILQLIRSICHLIAVVAVTVWGFLAWPLPLPGIFTGAGLLILSVLLWALFLSPRPVLRVDRFGQALFELLLVAGAVAALLALGIFWVIPAAFGIFAAIIGFIASTRTR